ncbi:MAG: response regulator [Magnetococcales bacterium]|nr:response regulator [Magnetococcales bacterium]
MSDPVKRATLLLVDDLPANIKILLTALRDEFEILVATSGPLALKTVANKPVDLIVLDIVMPEMDGYEVCRQLKDNEATSNIPVIFLTGGDADSDEREGLALGAVDYVTKPVNPQLLKRRIESQLTIRELMLRVTELEQALAEKS